MFDTISRSYKNYEYWLEHSKLYSILHVLEFCGSERYVMEAALALPAFDNTRPPYADIQATKEFFAANFKKLPAQYQKAITRNGNLTTSFFLLIIDSIDWSVLVENRGVDFEVFKNYFSRYNVYVCANSNIRKDVFDLFDRSLVLKKLNTIQKLRSLQLDPRTELFHLAKECKTDEEKAVYVDRIVRPVTKSQQPVWLSGTSNIFWYNYYMSNPKMCAVFCDSREFLENNVAKLDWSFVCMNPSVDGAYLKRRIGDINRTNLLKSRTANDLVELFEDSYPKLELFNWYVSIKFPDPTDKFKKQYFGNRSIFDPATIKKQVLLAAPIPEEPEASV